MDALHQIAVIAAHITFISLCGLATLAIVGMTYRLGRMMLEDCRGD